MRNSEDNTKQTIKKWAVEIGLKTSSPEQGPVACSYEHGDEPPGSTKGEEFSD
jgi:hypothetical protein